MTNARNTSNRYALLAVGAVIVAVVLGGVLAYTTGIFDRGNTGYLVVAAQDPGQVAGVQAIFVQMSEIQVHGTNGTWITLYTNPVWVKLDYVLNTSTSVVASKLKTGTYDELRVIIPQNGVKVLVNASLASVVGLTGLVNISAVVPSGSETGIKIYQQFTIRAATTSTVVIHFHLIQTGSGSYMLTPQTNSESSGTGQGNFSETFMSHLIAIAKAEVSNLSLSYATNASIKWDINQSGIILIERANATLAGSSWSKLFSEYNVSSYSMSSISTSVRGNTATSSGILTLNITVGKTSAQLVLDDTASYYFNGQTWAITTEQIGS
jgi:hypothetical protein